MKDRGFRVHDIVVCLKIPSSFSEERISCIYEFCYFHHVALLSGYRDPMLLLEAFLRLYAIDQAEICYIDPRKQAKEASPRSSLAVSRIQLSDRSSQHSH
jgi:hypothetical protein